MSAAAPAQRLAYNEPTLLDTLAAWLLALLWILPLAYAVWTAFHPAEYSTRFALAAPLTLDNFRRAWEAAPFARYFVNSFALVTMVLAAQLVQGSRHIGTKLGGTIPLKVQRLTRGHVLRYAVEQPRDSIVLVWPVRSEDVVGPAPE